MATFTVCQCRDPRTGLAEPRRVTRGPIGVLTCDPDLVRDFWLYKYPPEVPDRYPPISELVVGLGGATDVRPVPVPGDCVDGFNEAYYARPEQLLDPRARQACSAWSFEDETVHHRFSAHLARDLANGTWERSFGAPREQPWLAGSLVLVVA